MLLIAKKIKRVKNLFKTKEDIAAKIGISNGIGNSDFIVLREIAY